MKRKQVIIITLGLFAIIIAGLVYNYTFNSKHRDIANEAATLSLSANELYAYFKDNEQLATSKYLDKVLETKGKITSIDDKELVLSDQIQVSFITEVLPKMPLGSKLTIKGRCVGYDELLEVVKIDQATIINKEN
ncbi:OB-fold putative lipoprotein [Flaviramulus sp. BrNp1-15]|uniref:OB-fold putative lipoprotein n=1 Tax=Flaviramulus sp. BrNp1-15 TaxID=2916754 RepID=UPI001EE8A025|nr:OB-fold putative lipoprotein [Flaviramulus sp. BrNp1-15]ULC59873.1 OB-fold putative lipoprotein [Flaviramulus sp. BrNp1-15]